MFTVDAEPVTRAVRGLERFGDDVRRHALKKLAAMVKQQTRERFGSKQSPDGQRWRNWSDRYAETRTSRHSLLKATGLLLRTLSVRSSSDGIIIGSPRTYARFVQKYSDGSLNRPFLGIGRDDVKPLERALGSWARQEMARRVRS